MSRPKPMPLDEVRRIFPVGTRIAFYPVQGLPKFELTQVRSEAWTLGHGETVVKIEGRTGGVSANHLALATDKQTPAIARCFAEGRVSARKVGNRYRATLDKLPLHADEAPQGFESREAATAFAKRVRDAYRETRAALAEAV
jgi:hypothetical protein